MGCIWVTGAGGFSATHQLEWLARHQPDSEVVALGRNGPCVVDLTDFDAVLALASEHQPSQVYHLAGAMPPASSETMWASFVRTTYNLMRALNSAGCDGARVLVSGSAAEYLPGDGTPIKESHPVGGRSPYGIAKSAQSMLAEKSAEIFGIELVIGRTFNLIGPGMSRNFVLGEICGQLADGATELKLGNVQSERDFIDIRDAVAAYGALMNNRNCLGAYNVCTGVPTSIRAMIDMAVEASGASVTVQSEADRLRSHDFDRVIGDPGLLMQATGWQAGIGLKHSVADVVSSFRQ